MLHNAYPRSWTKTAATLLMLLLMGCGPAMSGDGQDGGSGDGGDATDLADGSTDCTSNAQCNGGVCVDGSCCPTQEQVCGQQCCGTDAVCFANACVVPGDICISSVDCAEGEYCEPALGPENEDPPPGTEDCLMPPTQAGRCLAMPPRCDEPGLPPGTECLPECEYHPPIGGPLDAVVKWQWGPVATEYEARTDVWSTPTVGRLYDANCDGVLNELDPPSVVFVSGKVNQTCCSCDGSATSTCLSGVLRLLDGLTGTEVWSLRRPTPSSVGFAGVSVALGDLDQDGRMEIAAVTGEGYLAVVSGDGTVLAVSTDRIAGAPGGSFGWGGALAVSDMNGDGSPEIAYGNTVFTYVAGAIQLFFQGSGAIGGTGVSSAISLFADLDNGPDGHMELLAGRTAYKSDGSHLWNRGDLPDGYSAVGDFDGDGTPEAVLVSGGQVWILAGATGDTVLGPVTMPGTGNGGPPTVADFDGDGFPEIGVAMRTFYTMLKPNYAAMTIDVVWQTPNHDLSSSVTGSTVFDFEGDGAAEVIYNDECFLWVYDGATGAVRFAAPTTSFTATEAALVADIDGDGHAEMIMIANDADPGPNGWKCNIAPWNEPDPANNRPAWVPPAYGPAYRGITVFGDSANSWVGTRTLWNQHTYHVTNVCDPRDSACDPSATYGSIPLHEKENWKQPWLNNFRQNVQDSNLFDAPDATLSITVDCTDPVVLHGWLRNQGAALLPAGVEVGFFVERTDGEELIGSDFSQGSVFPGQVAEVELTVDATAGVSALDTFFARILIDPANPTFHECREDNNESDPVKAICVD